MWDTVTRLLNSRIWIVLSIVCLFFAVYEAVEKMRHGDNIEGALDVLVTIVISVNLVNKLKMLAMYAHKLRR